MIADLKPYLEYKESGLPWLGKVPGHWDERRLRSITSQAITNGVGESAHAFREDWLRYVRITDIADWRSLRRHTRASLPPSLAQGADVRKGDLLIAAVGATFGKAYVHLSDEPACCAGYLVRVRLGSALDPQFAGYWTESQHYWGQLRANVIQSTIQNFSAARVKRLLVVVPPPAEQAAIVRFLDWANGRLERAIRAKRRVIALLNEQKQAIIHRAVTRGLDPSVPLKPSGIPWLGDIPQHWRIVRNMALFAHRVEAGIAGLPVLQVSLRSGITAEDLDQFGRPKKLIADPTKYKRIGRGDIAYNTMRMWQGAVGVSPNDGLVSPAYVVLSPRASTCPEFYNFIFHTDIYKQQVNRQSTGIVSDRNRLYWDSFKQMPNVCLPSSEQEAIVAFIHSETSGLNTARSRLESDIQLLREYRTRLVADVVTGKLDVREAAAALPRQVPLDDVTASSDHDEEALDADGLTETEGDDT